MGFFNLILGRHDSELENSAPKHALKTENRAYLFNALPSPPNLKSSVKNGAFLYQPFKKKKKRVDKTIQIIYQRALSVFSEFLVLYILDPLLYLMVYLMILLFAQVLNLAHNEAKVHSDIRDKALSSQFLIF